MKEHITIKAIKDGGMMENDFQFCIGCGSRVDKGFGFCPKCGAKIPKDEQEPVINTPPSNQYSQNYGVNYSNNNTFNQPGNTPQYYRQYRPPQYFSPKRKSNTPLIIVLSLVVVLILSAGGYFGLKALQGRLSGGNIEHKKETVVNNNISNKTADQSKNSTDKTPVPDSSSQQGQKDKPVESSTAGNKETGADKGTQVPQSVKDPVVYLPKPYMKYTYESWYQDGTSGKTNVVTGVIPNFSIITSVELIEQSEAFTQHFIDGADGIYVFSDEELNNKSSLWLPFNARVGQSWRSDGVLWKVIQLGTKCDLGNMKFENCIVVEMDYSEAGAIYVCYIAPGYGTVLINDKGSKNPRMKLLSTATLSEKEANGIVKRYSPNATK